MLSLVLFFFWLLFLQTDICCIWSYSSYVSRIPSLSFNLVQIYPVLHHSNSEFLESPPCLACLFFEPASVQSLTCFIVHSQAWSKEHDLMRMLNKFFVLYLEWNYCNKLCSCQIDLQFWCIGSDLNRWRTSPVTHNWM